jgi:predicted Zn-dependent protease
MAGNLFAMLESITAISRERRLLGGANLLPSMRADGISITAG